MVSFKCWLASYLQEHGQVDPIADMARDVAEDHCFPDTRSLKVMVRHLTCAHRATDAAVEALCDAHEAWSRHTQHHWGQEE
jgi:hypothetical protein